MLGRRVVLTAFRSMGCRLALTGGYQWLFFERFLLRGRSAFSYP